MKINWKNSKSKETFFRDLEVNDLFSINTNSSKGAVYRKCMVYSNRSLDCTELDRYYMMEEATGRLFEPTTSPVKRVDGELNLEVEKPTIYE